MELHQLRYLVAVIDEGTFTAAGLRENVSQSGVSAQIKRLERELGGPLIDRSGRRVRPTDLGAAVLPHARAALESVAALAGAVDDVSGLVRGGVTLGMVTGCSIPGLMDALSEIHLAHPELRVTLVEGPTDALGRAVLAGELDLALGGWAGEADAGLESTVVIDEATVLAVPEGHRLAGRAEVDLDELAAETIVCLSPGTGVRAAFEGLLAARGSALRVGLEASAPETVAGLAVRGLGVAVLSESMVAAHPGLRAVRFAGAAPRSKLGLLWRSRGHRSAASRAVLSALQRRLAPAPSNGD